MYRFDWVISMLSKIGFTDSRSKKQKGKKFTAMRYNLIILGTVAIIGSWLHLRSQTASAQQQPQVQQSLLKQRPRQPRDPRPGIPGGGQVRPRQPSGPRPSVPGGGNLYEDILNQLREQSGFGRTRGDICLASPPARLRDLPDVIWSANPRFIWQGTAKRIELVDAKDKVLWSKTVTPEDRTVVYDGEPLQAGQEYKWLLYQSDVADEEPQENTFKILPKPERDRIAAELSQLQTPGNTPEQIALKRANYFAKKRLWSDTLQEIYAVQNPSEELKKLGEDITTYLCQ